MRFGFKDSIISSGHFCGDDVSKCATYVRSDECSYNSRYVVQTADTDVHQIWRGLINRRSCVSITHNPSKRCGICEKHKDDGGINDKRERSNQ